MKNQETPKRPRRKLIYNSKCRTCNGRGVCATEKAGGLTHHGVCPDCEGARQQGGMDREQHKREGYYGNDRF